MADLNVAIEMIGRDNASGAVAHVVNSLSGIPEAAGKSQGILGGMLNTLGKFGLAGMGFTTLAQSVAGFATSLTGGNSEMETYETQLATLTGSADTAKERLRELAEFGARTPFELPEIAAAEKVLLGFGLTGEKVFKLTGKTGEQFREVVGDIAAGTGASFQEIALNMGKFSAGATGEAISRFQEMGVATREQMADMGIQFSKSGELLSPLPEAMQVITQIAQQKFGGGMQKLSQTFSGQMSTLSDGLNQAKIAIMQPIFDVLKNSLASVNEFISSGGFQRGIQNIAATMANLVERGINLAVAGFQTFRDIASNVVSAIGPAVVALGERFTTFFSGIAQGATLAQTVNAAFGDIIPAGLNPLLDSVDAGFARVKAAFVSVVETVQSGGLVALWQQVTAAMSDFAPTGERIQAALSTIGSAIAAIVPQPIQDFVSNLISTGTAATTGVTPMQTLASVINTVSGAFQTATQFVKDHVAVQAILVGTMTAAGVAWGISTAVSAYTAAVSLAQKAVQAYTAVQTALNLALSANPIGIVVVALGALAAALVYAYQNSEEFREVVDSGFAVVKSAIVTAMQLGGAALTTFQTVVQRSVQTIQAFQNSATAAFNAVNTAISGVMGTIGNTVTSGWSNISSSITGAMTTIQGSVSSGWESIRRSVEDKQTAIKNTIDSVWNAIPDDIKSDLNLIYNHVATRFNDMVEKISTESGTMQNKVRTAWQAITTSVGSALQTISANVQQKWQAIQESISGAMTLVLGVVTSGWETITGAVDAAHNAIMGVVGAKWAEIQGLISTVMGAVQSTVSTAWEAVRAAIEEKVNAAMALIRGWGKDLSEFLTGLKETVAGLASSLGQSIVNGIKSGMGMVWESLKDWATNMIRDLLATMARAIGAKSPSTLAKETIGIPVMQGVAVGLEGGIPLAQKSARTAAQAVIDSFSGGSGGAGGSIPWWIAVGGGIGESILIGIGRGVRDNTQEVIESIQQFTDQGKAQLEGLDGWLRGWIDKVVAHRTQLLWRFNYAAYLRGEGTKVMAELGAVTDEYISKTSEAIADAGAKLQNLTRKLQEDIAEARAEAEKAAKAAFDQAAAQVRQLQQSAALQKEIKMQRDAFAEMQRNQKDFFDRSQRTLQDRLSQQEAIARIHYQAQVKLSRLGTDPNASVTAAQSQLDTQTEMLRIAYQASRDLQRATTDEERAQIHNRQKEAEQALADRLAEEKYLAEATKELRLNVQRAQIEVEKNQALQALKDQQAEEAAIALETLNMRQEIAERERRFNEDQKRQQNAFEESMERAALQRQINAIYTERDERIKAIADALAEKERQLTKAAEEERARIIDQLQEQLADYKREYLDKIVQAFHHAHVDIADFLGDIDDLAKNVGRTLNDEVIRMLRQIEDLKHTMTPTPTYTSMPLPSIPGPVMPPAGSAIINPMPNEISRPLSVTVYSSVPMTAEQVTSQVERSVLLAR